jgi:hypothetical protein
VLAGRRVCFNRELTERLSDEDVCSGRFERPTFWWRSVEHAIERRHGVYMPASYALENAFRKSAVTIRGCNFSMCKAEFLSVNGYDQSIVGRGLEDINLQARFDLKGLACKTIVREALQFHLHHAFDPVPHSAEKSREFCRPTSSWAASGIQSRA